MADAAEKERAWEAAAELFGFALDFSRQTQVGPDDVISELLRPEVEEWLREAQRLLGKGHRTHAFITRLLNYRTPWLLRELPVHLNHVARQLCRAYDINPSDHGGGPRPLNQPTRSVTIRLTQNPPADSPGLSQP